MRTHTALPIIPYMKLLIMFLMYVKAAILNHVTVVATNPRRKPMLINGIEVPEPERDPVIAKCVDAITSLSVGAESARQNLSRLMGLIDKIEAAAIHGRALAGLSEQKEEGK